MRTEKMALRRILSGGTQLVFPMLLAVLFALLGGALILRVSGLNVGKAYGAMLDGSLGSLYGLSVTFVKATPLILCGLGVALAFKSGLFNIGAEGQMYAGGLLGMIVGTTDLGLSPLFHLGISMLAGFLGGALWALLPGILNATRNTNLIITTILMNYIGMYLVSTMVYGPFRADKTSIASLPESAAVIYRLPPLIPDTRLHVGFIVSVVLAVLLHILINRSALGSEFKAIGENPSAAEYSGINIANKTILVMALSGGMAGLAGAIEILGVQNRLRPGFVAGLGYSAIAVALLGGNLPLGVLASGIILGFLRNGANHMQAVAQVPIPLIQVIEALSIVFIAVASFSLFALKKGAPEIKDE